MSIDRIRYFAAVVETRNLRKAAELVGISPPSMSKAISVLEAELECKLIHPEGRGIGITPKGLEIYRLSTSLLSEHRRFYQSVKHGEVLPARTRMASFEVFSSYFLAAFFSIERQYDVLLLEMGPGQIEQAILAGTIDLGMTYLPAPDPSLEYVEVGSFRMGIFGKKEWEKVPFEEWPFALPTTELKIHSSEIDSLDMWPRRAPKRLIKYEFELLETALHTSSRGASVLHCPDFIVELYNQHVKPALQLSELPRPNGYKASRSIKAYLVGKKGSVMKELEQKLAKFMRNL
jgi:DNA-binding transcriptional LysR family regulator